MTLIKLPGCSGLVNPDQVVSIRLTKATDKETFLGDFGIGPEIPYTVVSLADGDEFMLRGDRVFEIATALKRESE